MKHKVYYYFIYQIFRESKKFNCIEVFRQIADLIAKDYLLEIHSQNFDTYDYINSTEIIIFNEKANEIYAKCCLLLEKAKCSERMLWKIDNILNMIEICTEDFKSLPKFAFWRRFKLWRELQILRHYSVSLEYLLAYFKNKAKEQGVFEEELIAACQEYVANSTKKGS